MVLNWHQKQKNRHRDRLEVHLARGLLSPGPCRVYVLHFNLVLFSASQGMWRYGLIIACDFLQWKSKYYLLCERATSPSCDCTNLIN